MAAPETGLRATILVVSETASQDPSTDKCIPALQEVFNKEVNGRFEVDSEIVPDDVVQIQRAIMNRTDGVDYVNVIVTSGGTGFAVKDLTPEVRGLSHCPALHFCVQTVFEVTCFRVSNCD